MIHRISFKHAWDGVVHTFSTQPNMRFHGFFAVLVILSGFYFDISFFEWMIIAFTILLMFTAEMINTAMESIVDLVTTEKRKSAKVAKDVAAGMVLVNAIGSVIVGVVVFLPYVIDLFRY